MSAPRTPHDPDGSNPDDFARAMADVVPLARDHRGRFRAPAPLPPRTHPYRPPPTRSRDDEPAEDETGFVANGVDRRELRKLRRGAYVPGRRLDLHGLTARAAVSAVERLLNDHRGALRCVAIVHGRGLHSEGNIAVLRLEVRSLLRRHHAVLAYSDAPRDDGGSGAVYVLLRR